MQYAASFAQATIPTCSRSTLLPPTLLPLLLSVPSLDPLLILRARGFSFSQTFHGVAVAASMAAAGTRRCRRCNSSLSTWVSPAPSVVRAKAASWRRGAPAATAAAGGSMYSITSTHHHRPRCQRLQPWHQRLPPHHRLSQHSSL